MNRSDHIRYRRMKFQPNIPDGLFSPDEMQILSSYGAWLAALMHGQIEPETEAQRHFVSVCRGTASPESEYELVWCKFMKRKLWEAENPDIAGAENKVLADLGITGSGWGVYGHFR